MQKLKALGFFLLALLIGIIYSFIPWESLLKALGVRCESFECVGLGFYIFTIWIIITPLLIGTVGAISVKAKRLIYGLQVFGIALLILGFFMFLKLYYINRYSNKEIEQQREKSEQVLRKEVEENKKIIENSKWIEEPNYRFKYEKSYWELYIEEADQLVFVRNRPKSAFIFSPDNLSLLGTYLLYSSGPQTRVDRPISGWRKYELERLCL